MTNQEVLTQLSKFHFKLNVLGFMKTYVSLDSKPESLNSDLDSNHYYENSKVTPSQAVSIVEDLIFQKSMPSFQVGVGISASSLRRVKDKDASNEIHLSLDFASIENLPTAGMYFLVSKLLPSLLCIPLVSESNRFQILRKSQFTPSYKYPNIEYVSRFKAISLCGIEESRIDTLQPILKCVKMNMLAVRSPYTSWFNGKSVEEFCLHNHEFLSEAQQRLIEDIYCYYDQLPVGYDKASHVFYAKDIVALDCKVQRTVSGVGAAMKRLATDYPNILQALQIQTDMGTHDQRTSFAYRFPYHIS